MADFITGTLCWGRPWTEYFLRGNSSSPESSETCPLCPLPLGCQAYATLFRSRWTEPFGFNDAYAYDPREREAELPRKVNPYNNLFNRRDWYYWFVRRKKIVKWLYIIRQKMAWNEGNFDAINVTFYDVMADWYKWTSPPAKLLLPNKTKIAVAQMNCTEDKEENLEVAINFIKTAATKHASMIFFPECFDFVGENKAQTLQLAEPLDGFLITRYSELAKQFGIWISLGGFHEHEKDEGERVVPTTGGKADDEGGPCLRNAHLLLNPEGELVSVYRKMHLFNVDIPEKNISLHESSYVRPGDELVLSEVTPIGRIGLGVCYDLRFPEFGMAYRAQGAHVLTYPSAFTVHTGQAHWEPLCRARAIENQCFVIAAAQCGEHNAKRASYGNSVIVDPWGTILAQAEGSNPGLIFAEIDLAHLEKVRQEMPVISHKAPGLLSVLGKDSGLREDEYTAQNALVTNILTAAAPETKSELGLCTIPTTDNSRAATFLFGPIVAKYEIVFLENKNARAFVNRKCIVPGHVLISTKRVAKRLSDLYPEEVADLFLLAQKVEQIMESVHNVTSSTVTLQDGKDAGQTVPHVHIHVVPRKVNDFEDNDSIYKELATHDKGADIAWRKPEEMKDECDRLRAYIRTNFPQFLAP